MRSPGDRQEAIFWDDEDRRRYLKTLGETCGKAGWEVHAYCLMEKQFHLLMEACWRTEGHADEEMWSGVRRGWRIGAEG